MVGGENGPKSSLKNSAASHFGQPAANPTKDFLEVYYFTPTEGLDQETCKIFNDYFQKLKHDFETRLHVLNSLNQELSWKVALIDESKKVSEMNSQELIELTFAKEKD